MGGADGDGANATLVPSLRDHDLRDGDGSPGEALGRIPPSTRGHREDVQVLPDIRRFESQASDSRMAIRDHQPRLRDEPGRKGVDVSVLLQNRDTSGTQAADVTVQLLDRTGSVLAELTRTTGPVVSGGTWAETFSFDGLNLPPNVDATQVAVHDRDPSDGLRRS